MKHRFRPRRGRWPLGAFLWLRRVSDKARAHADGALGDYVYPCPVDRGMMDRWGIARDAFEAAIARHPDDEGLLAWANASISPERAALANSWVSIEWYEDLDEQDREEFFT